MTLDFGDIAVRGSVVYDCDDLGSRLWFGCGGGADVVFKPADVEDLCAFLRVLPVDVPRYVIGAGSNVIIRESGVRGVIIRLRRGFLDMEVRDGLLVCGGGALDVNVAKFAFQEGLSGLEFFAGIPGTVGGAVKMNAGALGSECKDFLESCEVVDERGRVRILGNRDLSYGYRSSSLSDGWIVVSASFRLRSASHESIELAMNEVRQHRIDCQPVRGRTGGSTFKNPPDMRAWELIDKSGCRDLRVGGAYLSEKHCNFMFNDGTASASDLESLGDKVREHVLRDSGVELEWEIKRLGEGYGHG